MVTWLHVTIDQMCLVDLFATRRSIGAEKGQEASQFLRLLAAVLTDPKCCYLEDEK